MLLTDTVLAFISLATVLNTSSVELGFPDGSAGKESACNVGDLGLKDPLEKGKATHSSVLAWRIPRTVIVHGVVESQKRLSDFHFHFCS